MRVLYGIRSIFGLVFAVVLTFVLSVAVIAFAAMGRHGVVDGIKRFWARAILRAFNIDVIAHGLDVVPLDRGVLFLFNHQSFFDIFCLYGNVQKRIRFGAKVELFKIPVFAQAMRMVGTLPIAREKRTEVFKIYHEAEAKFAANWNFALAPEGTRQFQPAIGRFKKGPFIFAINAHAPIVPVVLRGALEVMPKNTYIPNADRWSRTIHMQFLPPIETKDWRVEDVDRLLDTVHSRMVDAFDQLPREN